MTKTWGTFTPFINSSDSSDGGKKCPTKETAVETCFFQQIQACIGPCIKCMCHLKQDMPIKLFKIKLQMSFVGQLYGHWYRTMHNFMIKRVLHLHSEFCKLVKVFCPVHSRWFLALETRPIVTSLSSGHLLPWKPACQQCLPSAFVGHSPRHRQ